MSKYTIEPNEQAQIGLEYQATLTAESVQDMIQRRIDEIGVAFWHDQKRAKAKELIEKIQDDPDAYADAIKPIYDAKVAVEEAVKAEAILQEEINEVK